MWIEAIGYLGMAFTVLSYAVSTIIPLRIISLMSSVAFVIYGYLLGSIPIMAMELLLIPLNGWRLYQMVRLVKDVKAARTDGFDSDWIKPFAKARRYRAGEVLFRKGDDASEMYAIQSGRFRLIGKDVTLSEGDLVGELGFLSPGNKRTLGLECVEDGEMLCLSYDDFKQLYFQNPEFGFYFLRLVSDRMFQNSDEAALPSAPRHVTTAV
jgi:CRP/FNR family transcriptional regulator, cyclic AMP receptor protein